MILLGPCLSNDQYQCRTSTGAYGFDVYLVTERCVAYIHSAWWSHAGVDTSLKCCKNYNVVKTTLQVCDWSMSNRICGSTLQADRSASHVATHRHTVLQGPTQAELPGCRILQAELQNVLQPDCRAPIDFVLHNCRTNHNAKPCRTLAEPSQNPCCQSARGSAAICRTCRRQPRPLTQPKSRF